MIELINYLSHLEQHLAAFRASYGKWIYLIMFIIVFFETGVFILAPLLPSDTLIMAAGTLAAQGIFNIYWLFLLFTAPAVSGDSLNYFLGKIIGTRIFNRNIWIFNSDLLKKTQSFYARYGRRTVIFGRFIPAVRSLVPFTAGAGAMKYALFLLMSIFGVSCWVLIYSLAGYSFGKLPFVSHNLAWLFGAIGLITLVPILIKFIHRHYSK